MISNMKRTLKLMVPFALAALFAACQPKEVESILTVDRPDISGVAAQNPAQEAVMITSNTTWLVFTPKWVTPSVTYGNGNGTVVFTIDSNYKENQNSTPREGEIVIEGGRKSITIPITQEGYTKPIDPNASIGGIPSREELLRFAKAVNEGLEGLDRWMDATGAILLLDDIDLTGETWIPIGQGTFTTGNVLDGGAFTGTFDGGGHKITGLTMEIPADAPAGTTAGFFGVLNGATVRNLTIGTGSKFTSHTTALAGIGAIAGFAMDSNIIECTSFAEMSSDGSADNVRFCMGGVLGVAASDAKGSVVDGCVNRGKLTSVNTANTKNGATGLSIGGVIGFTDAKASEFNVVKNCVNNGELDVQATRTGGVVATLNKYTKVEDCVNNAKVSCSDVTAINSRAAGIASAAGAEVYLTRCINKGDVVFPVAGDKVHGYTAGIIGQINNSAVTVDACENYGTILSDMWYDNTEKTEGDNVYRDTFMGLIIASCNSYACTLRNNKVGGKLGPYSAAAEVVEATSANFMELFSLNSYRNRKAIIEDNNVFAGGSGPVEPEVPQVGINSADDLKAFRDAVNAGGDLSAWIEDGVVKLNKDIDLGGEVWTPIGSALYVTSNAPEGVMFTGTFDGQGHTVDNFKVTIAADAPSGATGGLFGTIKGATVKNVSIGSKATFQSLATDINVMGGVVAFAVSSKIENCSNAATFSYEGKANNKRTLLAGIAGCIAATDEAGGSTVSGCENNGKLTAKNTEATNNGASGTSISGIVAFSDAHSSVADVEKSNLVTGCTNNGEISAEATRTAGVVASMNKFSKTEYCTNNAKITCTDIKASNSRVAGIVSAMGANTHITGCINNGDVSYAVAGNDTQGYAAGIIGQVNSDNSKIEACENYGTITSDMYFGATVYMGVIIGNVNNKVLTITGCKVGGAIGPFTPTAEKPVITVTADNFDSLICLETTKVAKLVKEGNVFGAR